MGRYLDVCFPYSVSRKDQPQRVPQDLEIAEDSWYSAIIVSTAR